MSRKNKFLLNTFAGVFKQAVTVICGFILPRYMLLYYGSSVNGLVSSITNFLSFVSLLDLGVGAVVQSNLYKPLADNNIELTSQIVKSSKKFFMRLALFFSIYILVLCFAFPNLVSSEYDAWFTVSLLLIISISTLVQYMFGMTQQILLNADQRAYVSLSISSFTIILNTVFSILLMHFGASVHMVKLMTTVVYVLRPIIQSIYVHRHYKIDSKVQLTQEPIKQKWNGFSQHFASVVCANVDIVVLTIFSTLEKVSVYSVYYSVAIGINQIIMTAATGLESLFGNMLANNEKEKIHKTFTIVEWIVHNGVTVVFTIAAITIVPFISVYTSGITDANYIAPLFGVLLVTAYAVQCLRIPYFRIIKAAGHFKETQNGAFVSAAINVILTLILVFRFDLIGTAIGTLLAMFYHTCYFIWYLRKNILKRSIVYFIKYLMTDILIAAMSYFLTFKIIMPINSYLQWAGFATIVSLLVIIAAAIVNLCFYRSSVKQLFQIILKRR